MMTDITEDENIPTAVWSGSFKVMGVDIQCHTLSDGQRVIEADSVQAFIEALGNPNAPDGLERQQEIEAFARWKAGK